MTYWQRTRGLRWWIIAIVMLGTILNYLVRQTLGASFTVAADLPPEPDHPVAFPQADYLKILLMRAQ